MIANGILSSNLKSLNLVATKQGSVPAASEEPAASANLPTDELSFSNAKEPSPHNGRKDYAAVFASPQSWREYCYSQMPAEEAAKWRAIDEEAFARLRAQGFDVDSGPGAGTDTTSMKDHLTNLIAAVQGGAGTSPELPDDRFAEGTKALLDHLDFAFYRLRFFATRAGENIDGITKQYESAVNKIIDAIATREEARKAAPSQLA